MMPPGWELWLDGGHNPGAGAVLAGVLAGWRDRPLYLVVGMLSTKDAAGFLAPLAPYAEALVGVTIPGEANPLPAEAIAATACSVGMTATTAPSIDAALARCAAASPGGRVLICGSLHFAGTVLAENT
jgi:dihydrofolate synthase/folylpolyglutamate synthase